MRLSDLGELEMRRGWRLQPSPAATPKAGSTTSFPGTSSRQAEAPVGRGWRLHPHRLIIIYLLLFLTLAVLRYNRLPPGGSALSQRDLHLRNYLPTFRMVYPSH